MQVTENSTCVIETIGMQHDGENWIANDCYDRIEIEIPTHYTTRQVSSAILAALGLTGSSFPRSNDTGSDFEWRNGTIRFIANFA